MPGERQVPDLHRHPEYRRSGSIRTCRAQTVPGARGLGGAHQRREVLAAELAADGELKGENKEVPHPQIKTELDRNVFDLVQNIGSDDLRLNRVELGARGVNTNPMAELGELQDFLQQERLAQLRKKRPDVGNIHRRKARRDEIPRWIEGRT